MEPAIDFSCHDHRLVLLASGQRRRDLLLDWIDGARHSLDLLFYDVADDASGVAVRDALVAAARRGVAVRLVVDGFGMRDIADAEGFFGPLRAAGGTAFAFNARFGRRYLIRNHQKIVIADGARAIIGGANIADDYFSDAPGAWRDLWLTVEGAAVAGLATYYEAIFGWMKRKSPNLRSLADLVARASTTEGPLQWQFSAPWPRHTPWPSGLIRDLWSAREIDLVAAYFSPSAAMLRRLERIARDGGQVRLLTPAKSDNDTTIAAARHSYHQLLDAGVDIWEYERTKMHTKLVVIDDAVHIGSSNFDFRSLFLNLEVMLRIEDAGVAARLRQWVRGELAQARAITPELHARRDTLWQRTLWALANFLVTSMDYTVSRRLNLPLGDDD
ncbi:phospholipase D-like domain-containing protein [Sphingomicrobium astaxanthinifaciens]|uniref:phospholipase D-like domain-containing protein n=1 Tax=Sphingomicrobium astaxanthinifaciens TaxID=1227949 RepID=UPI001FCC23D5|nr:phosphatidylserine/phosphatidylglycerophosphate/cardiolipin synthase family protein [Sphingomicrobium astaxanthinifaciens]MCJ7421349.1 phosphatidylserine/phosphatidylglycerophosphate/cardiolipin synthase family protein [Sphingomicrobium astaxanthinifaciens]